MRNLIAVAIGSLIVGVTLTALTLSERSSDRLNGNYLTAEGTMVACEPGQRALVRRLQSLEARELVECVTADPRLYEEGAGLAPMLLSRGGSDMQIVRTGTTAVERVPVVERQVIYRDAPVRRDTPRRSWQKSALIIGGSAGAGAGVGAAVGGKKGALIGAAIGGGAATLYDQITRRR
jgi:hypothetical protein